MSQDQSPSKFVQEARRSYRADDYAGAAEAYAAAARAYNGQDPLAAAEMRSNQSVALLQMDAYREALHSLEGVAQVFAEAGDSQRQAVALSNRAAALDGAGRVEEAVAVYRKASEMFEEMGDTEKQQQVMQALSAAQLRSRQPMGALASMIISLDRVENPSLLQRGLKKFLKIPLRLLKR